MLEPEEREGQKDEAEDFHLNSLGDKIMVVV